MRMSIKILIPLFLGILVTAVGCNSDDSSSNDISYNQSALLNNMAVKVIVPSLKEYQDDVKAMEAGVNAFESTPDQSELSTVRTAFKQAYLSWQQVAYFDFGPANSQFLLSSTNIYPTDVTQIEANIASGSYDLNSAANNAAKGWPAVDYLLFGASDDAAQLDLYTTDASASKRLGYLKNVIQDMISRTDATISSWEGSYSSSFAENTGADVGSSVSLLVNAMNQVFERHVRDGKIGIPAGVRNIVSGSPEPTKVEAYYATDYSMDLSIEAMDALERILSGTSLDGADGEGLYEFMDAVGAKKDGAQLSAEIRTKIVSITSKMNAVNGSWSDYVSQQQSDAQAIFDEMQELVVMLKVDMPAAFSVSIVYLDSDGD